MRKAVEVIICLLIFSAVTAVILFWNNSTFSSLDYLFMEAGFRVNNLIDKQNSSAENIQIAHIREDDFPSILKILSSEPGSHNALMVFNSADQSRVEKTIIMNKENSLYSPETAFIDFSSWFPFQKQESEDLNPFTILNNSELLNRIQWSASASIDNRLVHQLLNIPFKDSYILDSAPDIINSGLSVKTSGYPLDESDTPSQSLQLFLSESVHRENFINSMNSFLNQLEQSDLQGLVKSDFIKWQRFINSEFLHLSRDEHLKMLSEFEKFCNPFEDDKILYTQCRELIRGWKFWLGDRQQLFKLFDDRITIVNLFRETGNIIEDEERLQREAVSSALVNIEQGNYILPMAAVLNAALLFFTAALFYFLTFSSYDKKIWLILLVFILVTGLVYFIMQYLHSFIFSPSVFIISLFFTALFLRIYRNPIPQFSLEHRVRLFARQIDSARLIKMRKSITRLDGYYISLHIYDKSTRIPDPSNNIKEELQLQKIFRKIIKRTDTVLLHSNNRSLLLFMEADSMSEKVIKKIAGIFNKKRTRSKNKINIFSKWFLFIHRADLYLHKPMSLNAAEMKVSFLPYIQKEEQWLHLCAHLKEGCYVGSTVKDKFYTAGLFKQIGSGLWENPMDIHRFFEDNLPEDESPEKIALNNCIYHILSHDPDPEYDHYAELYSEL